MTRFITPEGQKVIKWDPGAVQRRDDPPIPYSYKGPIP